MKQSRCVIATALVVALLAVSHIRIAEALGWQEQVEKRKGEEKAKPESNKNVSGALGTDTNPVRCDGPKGERQYLSRLRCSDGERPTFSRMGSYGIGPYGNILDGYRVKCEGVDEVTVFMDMYHSGYVEKEPVPGFTIVD